METSEAIRTRRTIGRSEGDVPAETIRALIEAATWAPNHKLTEPWRFTVLRGDARKRLGEIWAQRAAEEIDPAKREAFIAGEARKPLRAPIVVAVATCTDADPVRAAEDFAATAAAVENLLLEAHARGLAAGWKTGRITGDAEVKRFLGFDPTDRIVAMIYLGARASEEPETRPRAVEPAITWLD